MSGVLELGFGWISPTELVELRELATLGALGVCLVGYGTLRSFLVVDDLYIWKSSLCRGGRALAVLDVSAGMLS